ncbi:BMP/retinoic acid-inducible neural-specific protein 1 [Ilyodon furcidens]|uniref:BMP/retinoic acid-inducible neural-specific protein 1 n=1 Tax=Ilyodon furcidens TaxID=33524 RepID=A0ABV0VG90_9TELE
MYLAKNKLDRKLVNATQNVEALHQLASSYFIDRDGTMRKLHEIQISTNAIKSLALSVICIPTPSSIPPSDSLMPRVTETRTGPLGCSSYDNLDSVSSILLQSPESKLHLQGKQIKNSPMLSKDV